MEIILAPPLAVNKDFFFRTNDSTNLIKEKFNVYKQHLESVSLRQVEKVVVLFL